MTDDTRRETNTQRELRILRDYVHLLADAIDKSPMPFAASYPDGRTMAFNEAFSNLTGYSEDELRTLQWVLYLTPPEWQEKEASALEELRQSGKSQVYEKEFLRKDGSRVPVEITICQVADNEGKVQYYYTLAKDLTDKKKAEATEMDLRAYADSSWNIIDASSDGLIFVRDGAIVDINGAFAEMLGYHRGDVVGMPAMNLAHESSKDGLRRQIVNLGGPASEVALKKKDGSVVAVDVSTRSVDYRGLPTIVVRARDVSYRRVFEEEREQLMAEKSKLWGERDQLIKELGEVHEQLSDLTQIVTANVDASDHYLAIDTLLRNLAVVARADTGMVLLKEGDYLYARAGFGAEERLKNGYAERVGEGFSGSIAEANLPTYVADAQTDPRLANKSIRDLSLHSMLGVPISHGKEVLGVISLAWYNIHPKSERETQLLEIVADKCGLIVANAKLNEKNKDNEIVGAALSELNTSISSSLNFSPTDQ